MFSSRVRTVVAMIFLLSFAVSISWAHKVSSSEDEDSAAIKKLVAAYTDAFNRHDAHAVGALYAEDAEATISTGATGHGSKEIEEHNAVIFGKNFKVAQRADTVRSIRLLTPEIASVDDDWTITGSKKPDGADNPVRRGLLTFIMVKHKSEWLIALQHEIEILSPPSK